MNPNVKKGLALLGIAFGVAIVGRFEIYSALAVFGVTGTIWLVFRRNINKPLQAFSHFSGWVAITTLAVTVVIIGFLIILLLYTALLVY